MARTTRAPILPTPMEDNARLGVLVMQMRRASTYEGLAFALDATPALFEDEGVSEGSKLWKAAEDLLAWARDHSTVAILAEGRELAESLRHAAAAKYLALPEDEIVEINRNLAAWAKLAGPQPEPARRRSRRAVQNGSGRNRDELQKIRAWARARGKPIADRGRIPADYYVEYAADPNRDRDLVSV